MSKKILFICAALLTLAACSPSDPVTQDYKVSEEEWYASIQTNKPFLFGDNYKLTYTYTFQDRSKNVSSIVKVDSNKSSEEATIQNVTVTTFTSFENNKYYKYVNDGDDWVKGLVNNPYEFVMYFDAMMNYKDYTYDENTHMYKCPSFMSGMGSDIAVKFINKQIVHYELNVNVGDPSSNKTAVFDFTYGGQVVTLPQVDPEPDPHEVTNVEWEESFALDKPYYMGDNYKATARFSIDGTLQNGSIVLEVDNEKAKRVIEGSLEDDGLIYSSYEDNTYYIYTSDSNEKWSREAGENPADMLQEIFVIYGMNYGSFEYDRSSHVYRCSTLTVPELYDDVIYKDLVISFTDKKVTEVNYKMYDTVVRCLVNAHVDFVYDETEVILPSITPDPQPVDPHKVTIEQYLAATDFGINEGQINNFKISTSYSEVGGTSSYTETYQSGHKAKYITDTRTYYYSIEDNVRYIFMEDNIGQNDWRKSVDTSGELLPTENLASQFEMIGVLTDKDYLPNIQYYTKTITEGPYAGAKFYISFDYGRLSSISMELQSRNITITSIIKQYGESRVYLPIEDLSSYKVNEDEYKEALDFVDKTNLSVKYTFYENEIYTRYENYQANNVLKTAILGQSPSYLDFSTNPPLRYTKNGNEWNSEEAPYSLPINLSLNTSFTMFLDMYSSLVFDDNERCYKHDDLKLYFEDGLLMEAHLPIDPNEGGITEYKIYNYGTTIVETPYKA